MKLFFTLLLFIFCVNAKSQFITTIAGNGNQGFSGDSSLSVAAELYGPYKICTDAAGNVYFTDCPNHRIRKIDVNGIITTIAGIEIVGYSGDGGPATEAQLNFPYGVYVDAAGNIYIADTGNSRIRKINTNGIISTVAGNGTQGYSGDGGSALAAQLDTPSSIILDASGNLYIADSYNHRIRKVDTNGNISTVAGTGTSDFTGDGGLATLAKLSYPCDMTFDLTGNLLIADPGNNCVRQVNGAGIISTIIGDGTSYGYFGDGGPATLAKLSGVVDVDVDNAGNIYVTEQYNCVIRKVNTSGIISTIAGTGAHGYSGDGGPATNALLKLPCGLAVRNNKFYITDCLNNRVRMLCSSVTSVSLSATASTICAGNSVGLAASGANTYSYTWSMTQSGTNSITVSPLATDSFYVQAKDTNGCIGNASIVVNVEACVGITKLQDVRQVKIYPNPARYELMLSDVALTTKNKIVISNSLGEIIKTISISENFAETFKIDVSDLTNGFYFLSIENDPSYTRTLFAKTD